MLCFFELLQAFREESPILTWGLGTASQDSSSELAILENWTVKAASAKVSLTELDGKHFGLQESSFCWNNPQV